MKGTLLPRMQQGRRILVGTHGNTLRALMMHLQNLTVSEVEKLEIPTGTPLVCTFTPQGGCVDVTPLQGPSEALAA